MKLTNYRLDILKLRLRLSQCRIEMHYKAVFVEEFGPAQLWDNY